MEQRICALCTHELLETEAAMTYPCFCAPVHTLCGLRDAYIEYREAEMVSCGTCRTIFMDHRPAVEAEPHPFVESQEFKRDLKSLKKKRATFNRISTVFKRVLHQAYLQFREHVLMSLDFIDHAKKEAITTLKETPEYKEARKALTGLTILETRVRTKYNLGWDECRRYNINTNIRWGRWSKMPSKMMARKFRVRL